MGLPRKILGVIPARLGSTRLARKALQDIGGQTLMERAWRQATKANTLSDLILATDSDEIAEIAAKFGAQVQMTSPDLPSGSARAVAVAKTYGNCDLVVNIQGDMPFINPAVIDRAVNFMLEDQNNFTMGTIAAPIFDERTFLSSSAVKVVIGTNSQALYFSRAPIPHSRDGERLKRNGQTLFGYKHIGLYVYRPAAFSFFEDAKISELESLEKLEQLRVLERGGSIGCLVLDPALLEPGIEVDTAADLERARSFAAQK